MFVDDVSGGGAVVCWRDFARQTQSLQLSVQFSTREMGRGGDGGVAGVIYSGLVDLGQ